MLTFGSKHLAVCYVNLRSVLCMMKIRKLYGGTQIYIFLELVSHQCGLLLSNDCILQKFRVILVRVTNKKKEIMLPDLNLAELALLRSLENFPNFEL